MMMPGYHNRPELTEQTIRNGWLHAGDAGYVDEEGFLYLVDRIKDMIVSGGVNVYPKDIEEIIVEHEAVLEVSVFGAPHDRWGEVPAAAIVCKDGHGIDRDQLADWTNNRVATKFQRIHDVVVLDAFPRNVAGKTLKREIRGNYIEARKTSSPSNA